MRRIIFIILTILVVIVGIMAILPLFFKGTIQEQIKSSLNDQIEGTVDFENLQISLFNLFPKVELGLSNFSIVGINEFKDDTLVQVNSIFSNISLSELFKHQQLKITNLQVDNPNIKLKSLSNGASNWDLMGESTETATITSSENEESSFSVLLDEILINKLNLSYQDASSGMLFEMDNADFSSTGILKGNKIDFDLKALVEELIFEYDSVRYISNTQVKAESKLAFNMDQMSFAFTDGKMWLNELLMDFGGSFSMPSDTMFFDLNMSNNSKDFNSVLDLMPAEYKVYLEGVNTTGSAEIGGSFKGYMIDESYPAMNFNIKLKNGTFKYKDLPEQISQIELASSINKAQGDWDLMIIEIAKASAVLKDNPVNLQMKISTPMTDANIAGLINGVVDFNTLNKAIPMEGTDLKGVLTADVSFNGKQSDLVESSYEKFKSNGKIQLKDFSFKAESLKQPVNIQTAAVNITTSNIKIDKLLGDIGQSKFSLQGNVSNYLSYILKDETLKGSFRLNSDFVNLTELATIQNPVAEKADTSKIVTPVSPAEADSILAFQVPAKLDLDFSSNIKQAVFDRMVIDDINGLISLKNETLELSKLEMGMLKGKLTVNGAYQGNEQYQPLFDFKLDVNSFDVPSAYQSLSMVRKYMPIAARSQGKISTGFNLKGRMNEKLQLVTSTLNGSGLFNTRSLMIIDNPTFSQLKGVIKSEKLRNVTVDDFTARFNIADGNLIIKPFNTVIADQEATIQGKVSAKSELDFIMDFKVNRKDLGGDINKWFAFLPGSDNIKKIDVTVNVKGPVKKPEASVDLDKAKKQVQEQLKNASSKEIKDKVQELGKELLKFFK